MDITAYEDINGKLIVEIIVSDDSLQPYLFEGETVICEAKERELA